MTATGHRYRLFDLVIECDVPIEGLPMPEAGDGVSDVRVVFEPDDFDWVADRGEVVHRRPTGAGELVVRSVGDGWVWTFGDETAARVWASGARIELRRPAHFTVEDAATYLVGPLLGQVLRIRGTTALHASVVDVDGRGLALAGAGGAGKSTLAAAMVRRGHRLVAEDVAPLSHSADRLEVIPGVSFVKLWPRSASWLGDLPRVTPNWEKRFLDASSRYRAEPIELESICFLAEGESIATERLAPRDALVELIRNVYGASMLTAEMRAGDLDLLGDLVDRTAVWRVTRTADFADLEALADAVTATLD